MNQSEEYRQKLKKELKSDPEYRYAYAEDFLNTSIATQIRVIREQRDMTQGALGDAIGTKQEGISRLENVNHSSWKTETLNKIARALDVRLRITFETFGTLLDDDENFSRHSLQRPAFDKDPVFNEEKETARVFPFHIPEIPIRVSEPAVGQGAEPARPPAQVIPIETYAASAAQKPVSGPNHTAFTKGGNTPGIDQRAS